MHLTLRGGLDAVDALPAGAPLHEVADAAARGALLGARGNSGVITAALLRGWADELAGLERAGPREVRRRWRGPTRRPARPSRTPWRARS